MSERDLLDELQNSLEDYLSNVNGSQSIFIATLDGHLLVEKNRNKHLVEQLVPMAGSVLGISETLASQLMKQKLLDNIVLMENHVLGLFKIQDKEDSLFLGVICDRLTSLGKMINFAKIAIKDINKTLIELN